MGAEVAARAAFALTEPTDVQGGSDTPSIQRRDAVASGVSEAPTSVWASAVWGAAEAPTSTRAKVQLKS